ncbi:hypothetical protein XENTR_v10003180 [Xenopus tropicalis]|nr:hypothetical protein XENTR_v10003180 [Xenopus tropicalis]
MFLSHPHRYLHHPLRNRRYFHVAASRWFPFWLTRILPGTGLGRCWWARWALSLCCGQCWEVLVRPNRIGCFDVCGDLRDIHFETFLLLLFSLLLFQLLLTESHILPVHFLLSPLSPGRQRFGEFRVTL